MEPGLVACLKCGTPYAAHTPAGTAPAPAPGPVKLDFGDLLGYGLTQATRHAIAYLPTVGVMVVVSAVFGLFASLWLVGSALGFATLAQGESPAAMMASLFGRTSLVVLVGSILSAVTAGLAIRVALVRESGASPSPSDVWGAVGARLGNFLGTYLLVVLVALGVLATIVGVVTLAAVAVPSEGVAILLAFVATIVALCVIAWLVVRWSLALVLSMDQERGVAENLQESVRITTGNRGVLFGAFFVLLIASALVSGITSAIVTVGSLASPGAIGAFSTLAQQIVSVTVTFIVTVAFAAIAVRAYRLITAPPAPPSAYVPPQPPAPPST